MIRIRNLSAGYVSADTNTVSVVVRDVSVAIEVGETVCIVGESGSGKSTFLKAIAGLIPVLEGSIEFTETSSEDILYQSQSPPFVTFRNALENVCLSREMRGILRAADITAAEKILYELGLEQKSWKRPEELSGGMKRRLALAQSLFSKSPVLLLDEPFAELDSTTKRIAEASLARSRAVGQRTLLIVTHDLDSAIALADRGILFIQGRLHVLDIGYAIGSRSSPELRREQPDFPNRVADLQREIVSRGVGA